MKTPLFKFANDFEISFEPEKHTYTVNGPGHNGAVVTSWTSVLGMLDKSAQLLPWAVNCAIKYIDENGLTQESLDNARREWRTVRDEAADIGTEVHGKIERYIKYGLDAVGEMRDEVQNALLAFLDWEKETGVKWLASECRVYNPLHGVAGTFDAIGEIDGKAYLIDFKSSKGFYDSFPLQLGGYLSCLDYYSMPWRVENAGILRLDKKTGLPEWKEYPDLDRYKKTACRIADLFYMLKKRRLKNNPFVGINFPDKPKPKKKAKEAA